MGKNLKDAKQWTHDAAQRAKAFENSIEQLSTRLQLAKQDHTAQRAELQAQKHQRKKTAIDWMKRTRRRWLNLLKTLKSKAMSLHGSRLDRMTCTPSLRKPKRH